MTTDELFKLYSFFNAAFGSTDPSSKAYNELGCGFWNLPTKTGKNVGAIHFRIYGKHLWLDSGMNELPTRDKDPYGGWGSASTACAPAVSYNSQPIAIAATNAKTKDE